MCHCTSTCQLLFFLSLYIPCRDLHSFPTRRSSDLEGGVVLLAGGAFSVVVGAGGGVGQRGERCQEECSFELLVAPAGGVFAADGGARSAGDGGQAGVGGEVSAGGAGRPVADVEQDAGSGPDADAWHRGRSEERAGGKAGRARR